MRRPVVLTEREVQRILVGGACTLVRPMRQQPVRDIDGRGGPCWHYRSPLGAVPFWEDEKEALLDVCPFGEEGDALWVREPWAKLAVPLDEDADPHPYLYQATDRIMVDNHGNWYAARDAHETNGVGLPCTEITDGAPPSWQRAIYMPKEAARLHLQIAQVNAVRTIELDDEDVEQLGFPTSPVFVMEWEDRWQAEYGNFFDGPWVWTCTFSNRVKLPAACMDDD